MILLVLLQTEQAELAREGLGPFALTFMLVSMGAVIALAGWCYWRITRTRKHFDPDGIGPEKPPVPGKVEREGGI